MWAFMWAEINSSMRRAEIRESALTHFQADISDAAISVQGRIYEIETETEARDG